MTDQDTSPEAVERLAQHTEKACKCEFDGIDVSATLRVLSAERDALRIDRDLLREQRNNWREKCKQRAGSAARAEAAEAERDALKTQLAEAVDVMRQGCDLIKGGAVGADWKRGSHEFTKEARGIIARHQKETGT